MLFWGNSFFKWVFACFVWSLLEWMTLKKLLQNSSLNSQVRPASALCKLTKPHLAQWLQLLVHLPKSGTMKIFEGRYMWSIFILVGRSNFVKSPSCWDKPCIPSTRYSILNNLEKAKTFFCVHHLLIEWCVPGRKIVIEIPAVSWDYRNGWHRKNGTSLRQYQLELWKRLFRFVQKL